MTVRREDGEDALVRAFEKAISKAGVRPRGLVAGVGDDAAVIRGDGEDLVITNDVLVEGRHFERSWMSGAVLGWRAAAVNLSDVAAMGAWPRYALVSLLIPEGVALAQAKSIERGIVKHLARYGAAVIGGNVSATPGPLVVDVTLVGAVERNRAWGRKPKPGDAIVVAGNLGCASAGLMLMQNEPRARGALVNAYRKPVPRLDVARLFEGEKAVHAAIDVSDGFSTDVIRMCRAGGAGCDIDAAELPYPRALKSFCILRDEKTVDRVLRGGEDYALILGVAPSAAARIRDAIRSELAIPVAIAGKFTAAKGRYRVTAEDGSIRQLVSTGWDHFRPTTKKRRS